MSRAEGAQRLRATMREPVREDEWLEYLGEDLTNWSDELEELHTAAESHFIDVWTREVSVAALRAARVPADGVVADLGCSSGHLLAEVARELPRATLVGIDAEAAGLPAARRNVPQAILAHASATDLPFADASVNAFLALNLLEHVPDDAAALREMRRSLVPGGRAVLVVPANPRLYDYYDAHLRHERRYARGELAARAEKAGLRSVAGSHIGAVLYPGFWAVKMRNKLLHRHLDEDAVVARVEADIHGTQDLALGPLACRIERRLIRAGVRFRSGIRDLVVVERPA